MSTRLAPLLLLSVIGCTAIVESDARGVGIGSACTADAECHAGFCDRGLCTARCSANNECPAPSQCFANTCALPLKVGALYVGVVTPGEGWTLTHHEGLQAADAQLPYMSFAYREGVNVDTSINDNVDSLVKDGARVIVANSFSQRDAIGKKATQYPDVKFLTCASYVSNGKNAISYAAHSEQPWYIAGKVAAHFSKTGHLGYIGSFITPEVVRHINAFYLGARSINTDIKLEVAWLGFWYDHRVERKDTFTHPTLTFGTEKRVYREELLTYRLLEDGADVIGHGADNQRSVRLIEQLHTSSRRVWSFSNDNRNGCRDLTADSSEKPPLKSCLGSPYFNWGPLYARIFDQVHRGTFNPNVNFNEPMLGELASESIAGFQYNGLSPDADAGGDTGVNDEKEKLLPSATVSTFIDNVTSQGWQSVFDGPYNTTGQRDKDGDGVPDKSQFIPKDEPMTDDEYRRMCWFAEGIVEREDPYVAGKLVPALVPDGTPRSVHWLEDILPLPGLKTAGPGLNCKQNY